MITSSTTSTCFTADGEDLDLDSPRTLLYLSEKPKDLVREDDNNNDGEEEKPKYYQNNLHTFVLWSGSPSVLST